MTHQQKMETINPNIDKPYQNLLYLLLSTDQKTDHYTLIETKGTPFSFANQKIKPTLNQCTMKICGLFMHIGEHKKAPQFAYVEICMFQH